MHCTLKFFNSEVSCQYKKYVIDHAYILNNLNVKFQEKVFDSFGICLLDITANLPHFELILAGLALPIIGQFRNSFHIFFMLTAIL